MINIATNATAPNAIKTNAVPADPTTSEESIKVYPSAAQTVPTINETAVITENIIFLILIIIKIIQSSII